MLDGEYHKKLSLEEECGVCKRRGTVDLIVVASPDGYYLGYICPRCWFPISRESEYFGDRESAEAALAAWRKGGNRWGERT